MLGTGTFLRSERTLEADWEIETQAVDLGSGVGGVSLATPTSLAALPSGVGVGVVSEVRLYAACGRLPFT